MTVIKPFQAVYYNQDKVGDLSKVVCPPYDVISAEQQRAFYSESPSNFIRVMLGKDGPNDDKKDNKYTRAQKTFEGWIKDKILIQDTEPCIYFYKQEYVILGQKHSRLGFVALMKLQDEKEARVYPHENTHAKAKEDRLKLWKALGANLSCIFVCFSDRERRVESIFSRYVSVGQPFIDIKDDDGVRHLVWRLVDKKLVGQISDILYPQQLFIADGHHRYEVAQELRRIKTAKSGQSTGQEPFNYLMTYFTNMDSRDLQIFPMHRIVKTFPADLDFLEEFFRIDKIKTKEDLVIPLARAGKNEHAFGLYTKSGILLLRLKNKLLIDKIVTEGSAEFRRLDATILKYFVFDKVGIHSEDIVYTKDIQEVASMVDRGRAKAGFIMNPVKIAQLKNIALNGERMPPKTTYFYPKVLSGLAVHKM